MAAREARFGDAISSRTNGQTGLCRSAEDVELLNKLTAFTACANRGDVIKTLDAANLVFAHGMFKCGTQRTSVSNRAGILSQCAQRFLGDLHNSKLSKDPRQELMFMFNCGNYTQKHLRDAATAESKRTLSTSKSFTRVPVPFCNERGLRKKLSCALYWHQDLVRAMLLVARDRPVFAPLVRSHLRGVRYGISRQVQHYLERLSELCSKPSPSSLAPGMQPLTIDGLYKWSQTYSKAWMMGFEAVESEFADILDPAMCAASAWVAQASPMDTMRMHSLETVEASIAKDCLAESAADAVRTGMASKPVSGAICGLFLTSAMKTQEENARLHSIVAAMRTDFGVQLQAITAARHHHVPEGSSKAASGSGKSSKQGTGDSGNTSSGSQTGEGDRAEGGGTLAVRDATPLQRRGQLGSSGGSSQRNANDATGAADDEASDDPQPMELGGGTRDTGHSSRSGQGRAVSKHSHTAPLPRRSRDVERKGSSFGKACSDVSADTPMGGEQTQQLLGGADSLLDADLPMLHHPAPPEGEGGAARCAPRMVAVDPFAASELLATVPTTSSAAASAQLASGVDSCTTSAMHDSAFTSAPTGGTRLAHSHSAAAANMSMAAAADAQQPPQAIDSSMQVPSVSTHQRRASLPSMHVQQQQQQQQGVTWHQQQLQLQMLQQQNAQCGSQLAQCLPPWDQSSFMGGGSSSFMGAAPGLEGNGLWPPAPSVPDMHAPPRHMFVPSQHAWAQPDSYPQYMAQSQTGADAGYTGAHHQQQHMQSHVLPAHSLPAHRLPVHQQPLYPGQSLPAQPGNPFASAMATGHRLAEMQSTSFAM